MKKLVLLVISSAIVFLTMSAERMSDDGKAGYTGSTGELNCTDCHDQFALNSGGGSVALTSTNMTSWMYDPGVTYHMVLTVSKSSSSLFGLGLEALTSANVNAGTLMITNSALTSIKTKNVNGVSRRNVVHKLDAGQGSGSFAFEFDWVAPATNIGDVTFYFCGNAADGSGDEDGDYIYQGSQIVSYNTANGIADINSSNISIYPVPALDHFTLSYNLNSTGPVKINLYDLKGSLVTNLTSKISNAGSHSESFYLPEGLSQGTYILSIESLSGINSRKILVN